MNGSILVGGVGNVFLGDDGFGVEVVRRLAAVPMGDDVEMVDVGIRGVHLAYQLLDGYHTLILVDAAPRGGTPGELYVIEPRVGAAAPGADTGEAGRHSLHRGAPLVDAHGMDPASMLATLEMLGGEVERIRIVACEPGDVSEGMELTPQVEAAIPSAMSLVEELVEEARALRSRRSRDIPGGGDARVRTV